MIDTVGFAADPMGLAFAIPSGTGKHLVERLALADDRRHLEYGFTVEDPEYLSGAVSFTMLWDYRPDLTPADDVCDAAPAGRRGGGAPEPWPQGLSQSEKADLGKLDALWK